MKTCSKCGVPKDELEFYLRSEREVRWTYCKECAKVAMKKNYYRDPSLHRLAGQKWRAAHPERAKEINKSGHLMKKYGLSLESYNQILDVQKGLCAICEEPMVRPHLDHCHATGKVRAMLCGLCNPALGGFRDSQAVLQKAIDYLKKFS